MVLCPLLIQSGHGLDRNPAVQRALAAHQSVICYALTLVLGSGMQSGQLQRREFITLLGGAAAAWPLAAHGQQAAVPLIGVLHPASSDTFADHLRGFHRGLRDPLACECPLLRSSANQIDVQTLGLADGYREPDCGPADTKFNLTVI